MTLILPNFNSVVFRATTSFRLTIPPATANVSIRGQILSVHAKRPGSIRIEEIEPEDFEEGFISGDPFNVFVSNGVSQYELARESNAYVESQSSELLREAHSIMGLTSFIFPEILFKTQEIDAVCLNSQYIFADQAASEYLIKINDSDDAQCRLYIAHASGLPLCISVLHVDETGQVEESQRTDFSEWNINPPLDEAIFDPTPPKDAELVSPSSLFLNG